ncbi:MAG: TetR/AcrR family transcriptional regulator [Monoglobales bacterium]
MRVRDENKKAAITKTIIRLINEIGFANISMSKIAKATGVSVATLYVYYENKEDMFRNVYMDVKKQMIEECNRGISADESVNKL